MTGGPPFAHGETVTRLRPATVTDPYSDENTELDWSSPAELDIPGCGFNPGSSSEPVQDARTAVITRPEVYAPAGVDVTAADRLRVRGVVYQVDGSPQQWISPLTGWAPGVVVVLKDVEG